MTWEFLTRPVHGAGYVAWSWEWRAVAHDGSVRIAARTFATFRECVADAHTNGFTGNPDPARFAPFFRQRQAGFTSH